MRINAAQPFMLMVVQIGIQEVEKVIANEYCHCVILHSEYIKIDKEGDGLCQKRRFSDARNVGTRP